MKKTLIAALMCVPLLAVAQSVPLAKAAGTQPKYQSAFANYKAFKDQPVGVWREINDAAGKAGGWRAYAREQSQGQNGVGSEAAPSHETHGVAK